MKTRPLALALALILLGPGGSQPLAGGCVGDLYPKDSSQLIEDQGCGTFEWELEAQYGGGLWDEGQAIGWGTCVDAYYTCQCGHVGATTKNATKSFIAVYVEAGTYNIWWNITDWNEPLPVYCNPDTYCSGQEALQKYSVTSYIDYDEGYDQIQCPGQ